MDRKQFFTAVMSRDSEKCVICGEQAVDAHHIMDRKLFNDGGYHIDNGASVCSPCHILAEQTVISVEEVRVGAGIDKPYLPPGLSAELTYDKWGNELLGDGTRSRGPLFRDDGARKALAHGGLLYDGTFGFDS